MHRSTSTAPPPATFVPNRWPALLPQLCAVGLAAIFGYLLIYHFLHEQSGRLHLGDFPTFYQAAHLARDHGDIYLAAAGPRQPYIYPPLVAFAYVPLTFVSELHAAELMLLATAAMLAASLLLAAKEMISRLGCVRPGTMVVVAFCVALLNENQMRLEMTQLETDALILLMFVLALRWLDRRPVLAGLALAVVMNIKYLSIVSLPYLLLRRRWRSAGSMVVGTVAIALLPATLLGWRENLRGIRIALGGLTTWLGLRPPAISNGRQILVQKLSSKLSLSITSCFARLCGPGHSGLALALAALTALASLAIAWGIYRAHRLPIWKWPAENLQRANPWKGLIAMEWAGIVAVALAFSPDTNPRHLVLAVLINTLAVAVLLAPRQLVWRVPALAGTVLILFGMVMPVRSWGPGFYNPYSVPGWSLLIGYLLILASAASVVRDSA